MKHRRTAFISCALFALFIPLTGAAAESRDRDAEPGMVRIETTEVVESPFGYVVLLKAQNKAIPIFVDAIVAQSIHGALTGEKFPRPLSHDLMHTILESFEGRVSRVVIALKGATYFADLTVVVRGTSKVFDSRSSDAIALAIHFKAPMLVSKRLLDEVGQSMDQPVGPKPGQRRL
jgi:bifunctional DNase/RNase